MHHLTCGINSHLLSVNLIVFSLLLVHLRISPHHSHHLHSHHLSLPRPFTPNLKLNCFTNTFLHCLSDSFWTVLADLGLGPDYVEWTLAIACFSFFFYIFFYFGCVCYIKLTTLSTHVILLSYRRRRHTTDMDENMRSMRSSARISMRKASYNTCTQNFVAF